MKFSIYTSYFYQIRNFTPNLIPVSTALSDPQWYRPPVDKEYYIDKRGIICGLRYEPLIVRDIPPLCPCPYQGEGLPHCDFLREYWRGLYEKDKNKILKAFEYCLNKFKKELCLKEDPTICLMVYEAPSNPCSERQALQEFFNCEELKYPIIWFY